MKAIILAGGLGTRLRNVVPDLPKPLAPVNGRPFLDYIFERCLYGNFDLVLLSVGYLHQKFIDRYGNKFLELPIKYCVEEELLGTGGAIKKACELLGTSEDIFIINGDTYAVLDYRKMLSYHKRVGADVSIATYFMEEFDRYGAIERDQDGRILSFKEKKYCTAGEINAGVYCLSTNFLKGVDMNKFSFEQYMSDHVNSRKLFAYPEVAKFLDIGIPEDYQLANEVMK